MTAPNIGRGRMMPPPWAQLDTSSSFADGLFNVFWGQPPRSLSMAAYPSQFAGPEHTSYGLGQAGPGQVQPSQIRYGSLRGTITQPVTCFAVANFASTSERGVIVGVAGAGVDQGVYLGVGNTTPQNAGNNLCGAVAGVAFKQNSVSIGGTGTHTLAMTFTAATTGFYVDGRFRANATASTPFWTTTPHHLYSHNNADGAGFTAGGLNSGVTVAMGAVWSRELNATEIASLDRDPFQMLRF